MTDFAEWKAARTRVRQFLVALGEQPGGLVSTVMVRAGDPVPLLWDDLAHLVRYTPVSQTHNPADVSLGSDEHVRSEMAELRDHFSLPDTADAADVGAAVKAAAAEAAEGREWFEVADQLTNERDIEAMRWSGQLFGAMSLLRDAAQEMAVAGAGAERYAEWAYPEPLDEADIRVDVFRSAVPWHPEMGAASWPSVRLTHLPTGIVVSRSCRTELQSKSEALAILTRRVRKHLEEGK